MLTKAEKEKLIIELYEQNKTYPEIAKRAHASLSTVSSVVKKYTGEETTIQQKSVDSRAFTLFEAGRTPVQVVIELDVKPEDANRLHKEYLRAKGLQDLVQISEELVGDKIIKLVDLYKSSRDSGLIPQQILELFYHLEEMPVLEGRYNNLKNEVAGLKTWKDNLLRSIADLNDRLIYTDKILGSKTTMIDNRKKELENLVYEIQRLENYLDSFKRNNQDYYRVARISREHASQVLNDKRLIVNVVILSVLAALKEHPEKQLLIYDSLDPPEHKMTIIPFGLDSRVYRQFCLKDLQKDVYDKLSNSIVDWAISSASFSES